MTLQEDQDKLKPMMRTQELHRRAIRATIIQNHIELANDMSPKEKSVYTRGLMNDKRGYFRRVWDAIRGR